MKIELKDNWYEKFYRSLAGWFLLVWAFIGLVKTIIVLDSLPTFGSGYIGSALTPMNLLTMSASMAFFESSTFMWSLLAAFLMVLALRSKASFKEECSICGKNIYEDEAKLIPGKKRWGKVITKTTSFPTDYMCKEHKIK